MTKSCPQTLGVFESDLGQTKYRGQCRKHATEVLRGDLLKIKGLHGATVCTKCSHYDNRKVKDKFLDVYEVLDRNFSRAMEQDKLEVCVS